MFAGSFLLSLLCLLEACSCQNATARSSNVVDIVHLDEADQSVGMVQRKGVYYFATAALPLDIKDYRDSVLYRDLDGKVVKLAKNEDGATEADIDVERAEPGEPKPQPHVTRLKINAMAMHRPQIDKAAMAWLDKNLASLAKAGDLPLYWVTSRAKLLQPSFSSSFLSINGIENSRLTAYIQMLYTAAEYRPLITGSGEADTKFWDVVRACAKKGDFVFGQDFGPILNDELFRSEANLVHTSQVDGAEEKVSRARLRQAMFILPDLGKVVEGFEALLAKHDYSSLNSQVVVHDLAPYLVLFQEPKHTDAPVHPEPAINLTSVVQGKDATVGEEFKFSLVGAVIKVSDSEYEFLKFVDNKAMRLNADSTEVVLENWSFDKLEPTSRVECVLYRRQPSGVHLFQNWYVIIGIVAVVVVVLGVVIYFYRSKGTSQSAVL